MHEKSSKSRPRQSYKMSIIISQLCASILSGGKLQNIHRFIVIACYSNLQLPNRNLINCTWHCFRVFLCHLLTGYCTQGAGSVPFIASSLSNTAIYRCENLQ